MWRLSNTRVVVLVAAGLLALPPMASAQADLTGIWAPIFHEDQVERIPGPDVGDYAGLMVIDPTTAFNLVNLRFSREEEADADAAAATTLDRAGVSRRGLYDFFQRLREDTDFVPAWLSNHPTSESRAVLLGSGDGSLLESSPALDAEAFGALQRACQE